MQEVTGSTPVFSTNLQRPKGLKIFLFNSHLNKPAIYIISEALAREV